MIRLGLGLRGRANRIAKEFHYLLRNTILRPRVFKLDSLERVGCIYREPSDMGVTDRLLLFALVRGLRPTHALESLPRSTTLSSWRRARRLAERRVRRPE